MAEKLQFYLCLVEGNAVFYMFDGKTFKTMTVQACKDLYMRDTVEWKTTAVYQVVSRNDRSRTFVENGQPVLNIYIHPEPFNSFPICERVHTLRQLMQVFDDELVWLQDLVKNTPSRFEGSAPFCNLHTLVDYDYEWISSPTTGNRRLYYTTNRDLQWLCPDKTIAYITEASDMIRYPECMRAALYEYSRICVNKIVLTQFLVHNYNSLVDVTLDQLNKEAGTYATTEDMSFIPHTLVFPEVTKMSFLDYLMGLYPCASTKMIFNCDAETLQELLKIE